MKCKSHNVEMINDECPICHQNRHRINAAPQTIPVDIHIDEIMYDGKPMKLKVPMIQKVTNTIKGD